MTKAVNEPKRGETKADAPAILSGMRVRLRATERWCAGTVQGGSLGTVYFAWMKNALGGRGTLLVPCVRWDRIKAREGYHFAIGMRTDMLLPGWLELVEKGGF